MLWKRLITGPILIAILLAVLWWDQTVGRISIGMDGAALPRGIVITGLCLIVSAMAAYELSKLLRAHGGRPSALLLTAACWALLILAWGTGTDPGGQPRAGFAYVLLILGGTWFVSLAWSARSQCAQGAMRDATATVALAIYIGGMLSFLLMLRTEVSAWWIAGLVLIVKSCDIGAYFTGMCIGRHKLIPWLSPAKTIEGLIGGLVTSGLVGWATLAVLGSPTPEPMHTAMMILMGVLLGGAGQCGDLAMSLLKRDAGIKDSSSLLPGMGGVMDVLDSLLLAAPVAWCIIAF
jgi:phosphatidate cytidylyltransferase